MSTINTFTQISIDGYFAGPNGEIDWFKNVERDDEYGRYMQRSAGSRNTLLMGHTTYEMMKSFWPTEAARQMDPYMASVMNESPKVVVSKSLRDPGWENVRVLHEITREAIEQLKRENDITILGSGSIIQQLTNLGLIDEYCLVHIPVVLGAGKLLFDSVQKKNLKLNESKSFGNGIIVTKYAAR